MKNLISFARTVTLCVWVALIATLPAHAGDKITYYHNDALGSPVAATNQLGQVVWRETYKPHGERTTNATASATNKVWFTGKQEESALGINYFGARWYHPEVGRFLVIDPAGVAPDNLYSFNRYAYANNNPLGFFDPDGRDSQEAAWAALGETPPSARLTQAAANVAQAGRVAAEAGDAVMPHNAFEAALPFALGKLLKLGKTADNVVDGAKTGAAGGEGAGKAFSNKIKDQARAESNGSCVFCGTKTTLEPGPTRSEIDHAIPKSRGGNNTLENAQNTCRTCNREKSSKTTNEFRKK